MMKTSRNHTTVFYWLGLSTIDARCYIEIDDANNLYSVGSNINHRGHARFHIGVEVASKKEIKRLKEICDLLEYEEVFTLCHIN